MRKLIYILFLIPLLSFGQYQDLLLASLQQNSSPANLYTLANAANPDSEVNAFTGLAILSNCTISSVDTPLAQNGTHSLKTLITTVGTSGEALLTLSGLTISQSYQIDMYGYVINSGNWSFQCSDFRGWSVTQTASFIGETTDTWIAKSLTVTPTTTTPIIRIKATSAGSGTVGFLVDNIVITAL